LGHRSLTAYSNDHANIREPALGDHPNPAIGYHFKTGQRETAKEEIYVGQYRDNDDLGTNIEAFIEQY
jgi:hypothetical protein